MQRARLIPVSGIDSVNEAEQRATSALLAVLSVVRDLSTELLSPLGASRAQRATVDTYTEVGYGAADGRKIRPDGLIEVAYIDKKWSCLVEVKTGSNLLDGTQINEYWDLARTNKIDHVLTISNEIAPMPGIHPTPGLKARSNSPVQVSHISWPAILTTAIRIKQHRGVTDPEQAWLLGELIRYLEHSASGALSFNDMGPNWPGVRDGARSNSLSKNDGGVIDIAGRFDQLLRYAALKLGSQIGEDVTPHLPIAQRDPRVRLSYLVESLCKSGALDGALRIPNTAGDLKIIADLRAQRLAASVDVQAPEDRGGRGRVTWLVGLLREAPESLTVESFAKNARTAVVASLGALRGDRTAALDKDKRDPARFQVVMRAPMGQARKFGTKTPGFIDSVLDIIAAFYESVVQDITPWQPKAPQLKREPKFSSEPAPWTDESELTVDVPVGNTTGSDVEDLPAGPKSEETPDAQEFEPETDTAPN